ncbi:MAG TPA: flagellar export chaperone FlgN [Telluria sp.]|nr:flagellar export chaperone FlgN [Telluria sp.]
MTRMTRDQANARLAAGVRADCEAVNAILALLERQFEAAVRHRAAELATLAAPLEAQLEGMEARRKERVSLVRALHGQHATMSDAIGAMAPAARAQALADWQRLEQQVLACKQATARNGHLLAEQFETMQRVLHGEEGTYAPR